MGSGTDVAKEAAAMVVVDDDFSTIVNAIEEGKCIFFNIKNFLTFQLSTSIAALSLIAVANFMGVPNPLNPMQILWINIIMDGPPAQSLGVEQVDAAIMLRPPRLRSEGVITKPLLARAITSGLVIFLGTIYTFFETWQGTEDEEAAKRTLTITFTTFVFFDLFNAYSCRHNNRPAYEIKWNSNTAFVIAIALSILGQLMVIYFPPLQKVFRTVPLTMYELSYIVFFTSGMLTVDTVRKLLFPDYFADDVGPRDLTQFAWLLSPFGYSVKVKNDREESAEGGRGKGDEEKRPLLESNGTHRV